MKTMNLVLSLFITLLSSELIGQTTVILNFEQRILPISVEFTDSGAEIVSDIQEGLAITRLDKRYGLVNAQGIEILSPRFDEIRPFNNGYAAAKNEGKWTFINKQGKKLSAFRYDWVGNFENGYAPVSKGGKWGFVNEQGIEICNINFEAVRTFENGNAKVRKDGIWYLLSKKGTLSLPGVEQA